MNGHTVRPNLDHLVTMSYIRLFADLKASPALSWTEKEEHCLEKDLATILKRYKNEGWPFISERLPKFAKAFERFTECAHQDALDELLEGFHPFCDLSDRGCTYRVPAFLRVFTQRIVGSDSGAIVGEALRSVRQICYLFYKFEMECPPEKADKVISDFVSVEQLLHAELCIDSHEGFHIAREVVQSVLATVDFENLTPRHGPGCVATGEKGNQKWTFKRIYASVQKKYPYYSYYPGTTLSAVAEISDLRSHWPAHTSLQKPFRTAGRARHITLASLAGEFRAMERLEYPTAKLTLVPKDSRGPRVISMEPLEVQYLQQGLMHNLVRAIEAHPLTKGRVNFHDQTVNGRLALEASWTQEYATLDLKEASDRVSVKLVEALTGEYYPYLAALRSHATKLPNGEVIHLAKYAPMGSALCFPVLSLVVFALATSGCLTGSVSSDVFVFGDDLIVPTQSYQGVVGALENAGLRVNEDKSFVRGKFRESCGVDAYDGIDVTPTRFKTVPPTKSSHAQEISAWVAYSNNLHKIGYVNLAAFCREIVESVICLPQTPEDFGFLSFRGPWSIPSGMELIVKSDGRRVIKGAYVLKPLLKEEPTDGRFRLTKSLTKVGQVSWTDERVFAERVRVIRTDVNVSWCLSLGSALMLLA